MSILKKIFFISAFTLFVSALLWIVYNLSFNKNDGSNSTTEETASSDKETPPDPISKITAISKEAILSPIISKDNKTITYFLESTGQIAQFDFYGESNQILSSKNIAGLVDASWSVDKKKAILKTKDSNSNISFSLFDIASRTTTPLKKNLDYAVWQTNSNRILYKYYNPETTERTLNIADSDGNNWNKLADLPYQKVSIAQIPETGLVSFWNSGDAYLQSNFQSVPALGGNLTTINTQYFGADYLWNTSGDWVLTSHSDTKGGFRIELGIMNAQGGEYKNLGIPTFVSKCVWANDGKNIFYALPGKIPENSVLPNEYEAGKFQTADTFWKVNVKTGEKTRLVEINDMTDQYDAQQLFLNQSESLLFFVNKIDGKLYKIAL